MTAVRPRHLSVSLPSLCLSHSVAPLLGQAHARRPRQQAAARHGPCLNTKYASCEGARAAHAQPAQVAHSKAPTCWARSCSCSLLKRQYPDESSAASRLTGLATGVRTASPCQPAGRCPGVDSEVALWGRGTGVGAAAEEGGLYSPTPDRPPARRKQSAFCTANCSLAGAETQGGLMLPCCKTHAAYHASVLGFVMH